VDPAPNCRVASLTTSSLTPVERTRLAALQSLQRHHVELPRTRRSPAGFDQYENAARIFQDGSDAGIVRRGRGAMVLPVPHDPSTRARHLRVTTRAALPAGSRPPRTGQRSRTRNEADRSPRTIAGSRSCGGTRWNTVAIWVSPWRRVSPQHAAKPWHRPGKSTGGQPTPRGGSTSSGVSDDHHVAQIRALGASAPVLNRRRPPNRYETAAPMQRNARRETAKRPGPHELALALCRGTE